MPARSRWLHQHPDPGACPWDVLERFRMQRGGSNAGSVAVNPVGCSRVREHGAPAVERQRVVARVITSAIMASLALASGCEEVEQIRDHFRDLTPHEAYQAQLNVAGLGETAIARDWEQAGRRALTAPLAVSLPFAEEGYISPDAPEAAAYRFRLERGRRLTVEVAVRSSEETRVFVDLFRVPADAADPMRPIFSSESPVEVFSHEPWRGGEFILRLQPELLRGGSYSVTLAMEAQLAFPVQGHGVESVHSRFGAARDGGQRSHRGVDIFARRGTPVLAASDGRVNRVRDTRIGGKVVWIRDPVRNANVYYAHLDSQYARDRQEVQPGDTIGFVGNTGNARTTPPHLHFGLYRRGEGAVDPFPYIEPVRTGVPELTADVARLGAWSRVRSGGVRLRAAPSSRADIVGELDRHTPLRVLAGSGSFFRARLPDGTLGYVAARLTEPIEAPVSAETLATTNPLRVAPRDDSQVLERLDAGTEVPVLGRFGDYLYVRTASGRTGWLGRDGTRAETAPVLNRRTTSGRASQPGASR